MAKKVKIIIINERFKFNLPALPLWTLSATAKLLVKRIEDDELKNLIKDNEKVVHEIIKRIITELKHLEPFTLVEVKSEDIYIHVDIL